MPNKVWDEITYPFPNFNVYIDGMNFMNNFTPYFVMDVITYPCWDWSQTKSVKGALEDRKPLPEAMFTSRQNAVNRALE